MTTETEYLEFIHNLAVTSKEAQEAIDAILTHPDRITPELFIRVMTATKTLLIVQTDVIRRTTESTFEVADRLHEIVDKFQKQ